MLEAKFLKISKQEKELETQIKQLLAKRKELSEPVTSETNEEALKELAEWKRKTKGPGPKGRCLIQG